MTTALEEAGHDTCWLTRRPVRHHQHVLWDGEHPGAWSEQLPGADAVINVTGYSLAHWPWTRAQKQRFSDSRVKPARTLASAIAQSPHKPQVFVQTSGINYYGLGGEPPADETTAPGNDFLSRLSVEWEAASNGVEEGGVRRVVTRNAIVLDRHAGMLPLMALPVRLFVGGRLGDGGQAVPWVHIEDYVASILFLLGNAEARGPYNIVAPKATSSDAFMRSLAGALRRPYWLHVPPSLLRMALGEMNVLVTTGRYSQPKALLSLGFKFQFPDIDAALADLYGAREGG